MFLQIFKDREIKQFHIVIQLEMSTNNFKKQFILLVKAKNRSSLTGAVFPLFETRSRGTESI